MLTLPWVLFLIKLCVTREEKHKCKKMTPNESLMQKITKQQINYRINRNIHLKREILKQTFLSWNIIVQQGNFSPLNDWPTWMVLDGCSCVASRLAPWWEIAPTTQLTAPIICQSPARPTRSRWCQFPLRIELSAWLSVIERCIGVWKGNTGHWRLQEKGGHRNCYLILAQSFMASLSRSLSHQNLVESFCMLLPPK